MNIKMSSVLNDITGKSGLAIVRVILNGERMVDGRCMNSKKKIAKALDVKNGFAVELEQYTLNMYYENRLVELKRAPNNKAENKDYT